MHRTFPFRSALILGLVLASVPPSPAGADGQLEDNLSAYVGVNAEGYLGPLRDGIGGALNSGLFMYPSPPEFGFHLRLDGRAGVTMYKDEDRTFMATTDPSFGDPVTVEAPTVVGSTESYTITDPETGAVYTFPGGFDVDSFGLAAPQLTVGVIYGTEFMGRFITYDPNDLEIDNVQLWGVGARHSLSQWLSEPPVDIAIHGMYQNLQVDDDFIDASTLSLGAEVGKTFGIFSGYVGAAYHTVDLDATYESSASGTTETVRVTLERSNTFDLGLGATLRLAFLHLNGEYHFAERNSYALGIGLGN
ncbi:MAG TPA: DUF6588 family protein [Candidatus Eisenbacteria bacterium]